MTDDQKIEAIKQEKHRRDVKRAAEIKRRNNEYRRKNAQRFREFAKVIEAWADGADIEFRCHTPYMSEWRGWYRPFPPNFDRDIIVEWRVSPTTRQRECWMLVHKRAPLGKPFLYEMRAIEALNEKKNPNDYEIVYLRQAFSS